MQPERDIVLAFVADEEAGGKYGAHWLVDNHPDLFADCTEAISEVGGFSVTVGSDLRLYLIQTAEKGIGWLRLRAQGRPGHGSMVHPDNAVTELARAVSRIGAHEFPIHVTPTLHRFLTTLAEVTGLPIDPDDPEPALKHLGGMARMIGATLRNTANPTMLQAGYKANVIPSSAEATIDCRFLPGYEQELYDTIDELIGEHISRETITADIAVETDFDGAIVDAMAAALKAEDPDRGADAISDVGRHRRQVLQPARHPQLRLLTVAAAARAGLRGAVPRHRRTGSGSRAAVRRAGAGPVPAQLLATGGRADAVRSGSGGPRCVPEDAGYDAHSWGRIKASAGCAFREDRSAVRGRG